MSGLDADAPLRVASANVHSKVFDDEVVVLDMSTGTYHSLRGAAVAVWKLVLEHATPVGIAGAFVGAEPRAIDRVIAELVAAGVVVADPTLVAAVPAAGSVPFEAPEIETFTDMQEVLLLDPIHEVDETGWPNPVP